MWPIELRATRFRGQFVDDGGDHRVEICDLVMQLEVTAGEGFEGDAIGPESRSR